MVEQFADLSQLENRRQTSLGSSSKKQNNPTLNIKAALTEQSKTGEHITELGEKLQQERVDEIEGKLKDFFHFKNEVGIAVCKVQLQC